jgi:hypothetical protein
VGGDAARWGPAFDLTVFDRDGDAVPDLYVCNDLGAAVAPNVVLANAGGALAAADGEGLDVAANCMGSAWGPARDDGTLATVVSATGEQLLLERDASGWHDTAAARGLRDLDPREMAWGSALGDVDNDGRADLVTGVSDFYGPEMPAFASRWYRQDEDGRFVEEAARHGLPADAQGRGVLTRDLDGDGVPEVILGDALRSPRVLWSQGCTADAWIEVEAPPGSVVTVRAGARAWTVPVATDAGWASTAPARAHVGLGEVAFVDAITVAAPWAAPVVLEGPIAARRVVTWAP